MDVIGCCCGRTPAAMEQSGEGKEAFTLFQGHRIQACGASTEGAQSSGYGGMSLDALSERRELPQRALGGVVHLGSFSGKE